MLVLLMARPSCLKHVFSTFARAHFFGAERSSSWWGSAERADACPCCKTHMFEKQVCPRLGGSAFVESRQRDLGVSSKAHKFACELRALLASDKHLGSAERSESEVQGNFQQQTRQRVPEALWRIYRLRHCRRPILCFGASKFEV